MALTRPTILIPCSENDSPGCGRDALRPYGGRLSIAHSNQISLRSRQRPRQVARPLRLPTSCRSKIPRHRASTRWAGNRSSAAHQERKPAILLSVSYHGFYLASQPPEMLSKALTELALLQVRRASRNLLRGLSFGAQLLRAGLHFMHDPTSAAAVPMTSAIR